MCSVEISCSYFNTIWRERILLQLKKQTWGWKYAVTIFVLALPLPVRPWTSQSLPLLRISFPVGKRERGWTQRCVRSFQCPGFSANQQPKQIQNSQVFLPLLEPQGWLRRGTPACLPPQSSPPSIQQSFLMKVGADAKASSRQRNNVDDRPGAPTPAATQLWQEEQSQTWLTSKS